MEILNTLTWLFDGALGVGLLGLAWWTLASPELFRAIVLFVTFSLFMALVWVRLSAPDVALTEAAIGAGLTGALLMSAMARLRSLGASSDSLTREHNAEQSTGKPR